MDPNLKIPISPKEILDLMKNASLQTLQELIAGVKEPLKKALEGDLLIISEESAKYTAALLKGDPNANQNLLHLQAQLKMTAAKIIREESQKLADIFEAVVLNIARIAIKILISI